MFDSFQQLIFEGVKAYLQHRHLLYRMFTEITVNEKLSIVAHHNYEGIMYIDIYVNDILCTSISELGYQMVSHCIICNKACDDLYKFCLDMYNKYHYDGEAAQARVNSY